MSVNSETTSTIYLTAFIFLVSFLLGSIPFGLIVARIYKVKDLTSRGSGNIGSANVSRVLGFWPAGFLTFCLDAAKGMIASLLAMPFGISLLSFLFNNTSQTNPIELGMSSIWMAGFFAVLGHCYSPWIHFKGGKGVATGLGVLLVLSPLSALIGLIGFVFTFVNRKIVSLASISAVVLASVGYLVFNPVGSHIWVGAAMMFIILLRHENNIDALLENREKPFNRA